MVISDCEMLAEEDAKLCATSSTEANMSKKNKLAALEKYTATKKEEDDDDDEIELDEDDEEEDNSEEEYQNDEYEKGPEGNQDTEQQDIQEVVFEKNAEDQIDSAPQEEEQQQQDLSKMTPLQQRLYKLKLKMNQSRQINRKEVLHEGERLGTVEGKQQERRRLQKQDKKLREQEWEKSVTSKVASIQDKKERNAMMQPAQECVQQRNKKSAKADASRFDVTDHHNPEGQFRNYDRSLNSLPKKKQRDVQQQDVLGNVYDPLASTATATSLAQERQGARQLASELRRRIEKSKESKRARVEFEGDVNYIDQRNKQFNKKIARNFDKHTAEIRHNLERGTAS